MLFTTRALGFALLFNILTPALAAPIPFVFRQYYPRSSAGSSAGSSDALNAREVDGPSRGPDAWIVVLADGTNVQSHLYWLYSVIEANGGDPNPINPIYGGPPGGGDGSTPGPGYPGGGDGSGPGGTPGGGYPGGGDGSGPGGTPGGGYPGGAPGGGYPGGGDGSGPGGAPGGGYPGGAPGGGYPGGSPGGTPGGGDGSAPGGGSPGGGDGSTPGSGPGGSPGGSPGSGPGGAPGGGDGSTPGNGPGGAPGGGDGSGGGKYPGGAPGGGDGSAPGGGDGSSPGSGPGGGDGSVPSDPDEAPGHIPCPGNGTPFPTGTADGSGSGPIYGVFDGMRIYAGVFKGVVYDALTRNPDVIDLQPDTEGSIADMLRRGTPITASILPEPSRPAALASAVVHQKTSLWNLARISSRKKPASVKEYVFNATAGRGVDVYVLDTGVLVQHGEFGGRATHGFSAKTYDTIKTDDNGHGTHVAATIAGKSYGVARAASIIGVKVASGGGSAYASDVIAGIYFALQSHKKTKRPSIISLSLASVVNPALDTAAERAIRRGIHFVAAAGNGADDAVGHSPGRSANVTTVGALDASDNKAPYSASGPNVDIWAPGSSIISADIQTPASSATRTGTSMAAPHVSGVLALALSMYGDQKPAAVREWLARVSTPGAAKGLSGVDNNRVLYNCWNNDCWDFKVAEPVFRAYNPYKQQSKP